MTLKHIPQHGSTDSHKLISSNIKWRNADWPIFSIGTEWMLLGDKRH